MYGLQSIYSKECSSGYGGPNCSITCPYPTYGDGCQGLCDCDNETCDASTGCRLLTTGIFFKGHTARL